MKKILIPLLLVVSGCTVYTERTGLSGATACGAGGTDAATDAQPDAPKDAAPEAPPPNPCANGVKDRAETDVDCGGGTCPACTPDKFCSVTADCSIGHCALGRCMPIEHVVVIMQENRSFDSYFGTYPGADGIPVDGNGVPTVCNLDPWTGNCVKPYHSTLDIDSDCPHLRANLLADVNGGLMDSFIKQDEIPSTPLHISSATNASPIVVTTTTAHGRTTGDLVYIAAMTGNTAANGFWHVTATSSTVLSLNTSTGNGNYTQSNGVMGAVTRCNDPSSGSCTRTCMGYHNRSELGNYWAYADWGVLQDKMYEPVLSYSAPTHAYMVSGWSGNCPTGNNDPMACTVGTSTNETWTDLTWLLHSHAISWKYYLSQGTATDCDPDECPPPGTITPALAIWNPLATALDVTQDGETANVVANINQIFVDTLPGHHLPKVSWIIPGHSVSEHPPSKVSIGQKYVTGIVNAIGHSDDWPTTAVFISWDDPGGFYDHEPPIYVDYYGGTNPLGYGIRVPGLVLGPYAKQFIDHQVLSSDAYLKFIEDIFLEGARIDPATDGRPDPRGNVRENQSVLGNVRNDFDFTAPPRSPPFLTP